MAITNEQIANWRSSGLCPQCGRERAPGKAVCQKHLNYDKNYKRQLRADWRAAGRCWLCGEEPVPGKTMCQKHLDYHQEYDRQRRAKAKAANG